VPGSVVVNVTVDRPVKSPMRGWSVQRVRRNCGAPHLSSVLQWHFSTDAVEVTPGDRRPMPSSFEIGIAFNPGKAPQTPEPPAAVGSALWNIDKIDLSRIPAELHDKIRAVMTVREGQSVRPEDVNEQQRLLRKVDSHLTVGIMRPRGPGAAPDTVSLALSLRQSAVANERVVPPAGDSTPQRIRVGGAVAAVNLIHKVTPLYPAEAREARVQGVVKLNATIAQDGTIKELQLVSGHPLLVPAAVEAVKQWVYKPTLLNGNPVSVLTQIDVNFTLAP
jgi:TonB family protein